MGRTLLTAVIVLASSTLTAAQTATADFIWDPGPPPNDPATYFELSVDGGAWVDVGLVPSPTEPGSFHTPVPFPLPAGVHTAMVRACNEVGCSLPSDPVTFPGTVPSGPLNLRIVVSVEIGGD